MASVNEVLTEISAKIDQNGNKKLNRFSRKTFNKLLNAAAEDPEFSAQVATIEKGEFKGYKEVACGKEFRAWCKKLIERAGIDPAEAAVVESQAFPIGDISWMYDFFAEVLLLYLEDNKFQLPPKEDFEATLSIKEVKGSTKRSISKQPGSNKDGVEVEVTKEAHRELVVKSKCPKYLQKRKIL